MVFFSTWIWDCICLDTWIGFHWGLIVLLFCIMFHVVEVHRQLVSVHRPTICWKSIPCAFLRSKPYLPQGVQILGGSLSLSCKGMWLQLGRCCSKWVNNPASLLHKIQFPLSWKQSKRSISLSLSVLILLPILIMLNLFPLLWCFLLIFTSFFWQFLFPLWIYPVLSFSSLLPLFPKISGSVSQNQSLKIAGLCFCCIWQD